MANQYRKKSAGQDQASPKTIPLLDLQKQYQHIAGEINAVLSRVLKEARYILGPEVQELEDNIARYLGVRHCIGVASGTDALVLSLRAMALQMKGEEYFSPVDEVITTPFTFTATGGAILRAGATPVFVDLDPRTFNLDPTKLQQALTANTVGIIPVHLYGQPCQMDTIMKMAANNGLFVLEDVAQAFGASFGGQKLGSFGTTGAFSFFPSKNLGCFGDGGMVATNDGEIAELVEMLRKHGGKDKYNVEHIGYNSRLDTLQASVLLVRLKYLDKMNELRRQIADYYHQQLQKLEVLTLPSEIDQGYHVYHQYTVRVAGEKRDHFQQELQKRGISSAVYYPFPLHLMKVFSGRSRISASLREAEQACAEVLSLPVEPLLTEEELSYVVECLKDIASEGKGVGR